MNMNFARNFSILRRKGLITQEAMAEKCGVSRQAVTKWECGSSLPNLYVVSDIAEIFNVTVDELLHGQMDEKVDFQIDSDYAAKLDAKIDKLRDEILEEIRKKDVKKNVYEDYNNFNSSLVINDDIPSVAYYTLGCEEVDKGNYEEAIKLFEEALARGYIDAAFIILKIYDELIELYSIAQDNSEFFNTRLIFAQKMQQYGKIVETEMRNGNIY